MCYVVVFTLCYENNFLLFVNRDGTMRYFMLYNFQFAIVERATLVID